MTVRTFIFLSIFAPTVLSAGVVESLVLCAQSLAEDGQSLTTTEHCEEAASLGSGEAQYVLGSHYLAQENWEEASSHYQEAINEGFAWGHVGLGHILSTNNSAEAEKHYRAFAESNDNEAILGLVYIGNLRAKEGDESGAYSWFFACSSLEANGVSFCEEKSVQLEGLLTDEQISKAKLESKAIVEWFSVNKSLKADA